MTESFYSHSNNLAAANENNSNISFTKDVHIQSKNLSKIQEFMC